MYVCMYACMHECMHVCVRACVLTTIHDGYFIPQLGQLLQSSKTPDLLSEDEDDSYRYSLNTCTLFA